MEEERSRDEEQGDADDLEETSEEAQADLEALNEGRSISIMGTELPVRVLVAMGIFLAVFMAIWMLLWAAAGGAGLGLGWIVATVAGAVAVRLYSRRAQGGQD